LLEIKIFNLFTLKGDKMNKLRACFAAVAVVLVGGASSLLSIRYGRDYAQKPINDAISLVTKTEKIISEKPDFSWQPNVLTKSNPNPSRYDWFFGATLCNTKTIQVEQTQTDYTTTSNKERLATKLQIESSAGVAIATFAIPEPKTTFKPGKSCVLPTQNMVLSAVVTATPVASDENFDRAPEPSYMSMFAPDKENVEIAQVRQKKIETAVAEIKSKADPRVTFVVGPPTESQLTPEQVKAVLNTEYPLYNDKSRAALLSSISLIDNGNLNQANLKQILEQHRGAKVQVTKLGQVQQIESFPIPTGLLPFTFLAPPVRVATFSLTRLVWTTNVYIANRLIALTIFSLDSLAAILNYSFRLIKITARKLRKSSIEFGIFKSQQLRRASFQLQHSIYNSGFKLANNWAKTAIVISEKSIILYHALKLASIKVSNQSKTTSSQLVQFTAQTTKYLAVGSIITLVSLIGTISDMLELTQRNSLVFLKWIDKKTKRTHSATINLKAKTTEVASDLLAKAIFESVKAANKDTYAKRGQKIVIFEKLGFHTMILINFREDSNSSLEFSSNSEAKSISTNKVLLQFISL
jgi:hypothetical protein